MTGQKQPSLYLKGFLRILMTEWVPIGSHFVEGLQRRFGRNAVWNPKESQSSISSMEPPFYITSTIDSQPYGSLVVLPPDNENKVRVEGYHPLEYIRFECKIESLETGGDHQEELIGVDISHEGHICYGIQFKSTEDGVECASLGVTANIIADLTYDTSQLMNSLFNGYQRRLLDVVHHNDSNQRGKRVIVTADQVQDHNGVPVSLAEIQSNPAYCYEIRQVLGQFSPDSAISLPGGGFVMFGDNGAICINSDHSACLKGLISYNLMWSMINFLDSVFGCVAYGWDKAKDVHDRADTNDAEEMSELQTELSALSENQSILNSVSRHMRRDIVHVRKLIDRADIVKHADMCNLQPYKYTLATFCSIDERLADLDTLLDSLEHSIENIRRYIGTLNDRATLGINRAMNLLTIVSVIILPLTLIAGIYGMNFQAYAPSSAGLNSAWNMPELYWAYGYPSVLLVMALIAGSLGLFFYQKGLLGSKSRKSKKKM